MDVIWVISGIALIVYAFRFIGDYNESKFKQLLGVYVAWVFVNLLCWLMSEGNWTSAFFPFEDDNVNVYDFSEFVTYSFSPLIFVFVRSLMKS